MDYSPPGSSVHGISQARILEWVTISFSRDSSQTRNWIHISCIGSQVLYLCTTRDALSSGYYNKYRTDWVAKTDIYFLYFWGLEAQNKVLPILVSGESCLPGLLMTAFLLCAHMAERESMLWCLFLFFKGTNPIIPEWSSSFPHFLQFKSKFGNKGFMIWATVTSWSCFCWLYRASPSLAAKHIINLILVLTIWWYPCVESSLVLLEEGACYDQCIFLAKLY